MRSRYFTVLQGKTITKVTGLEQGSESVRFWCSDGSQFVMLHQQDCCEYVRVEDVCGDPQDVVGQVVRAEEVSGESGDNDTCDHYTWTFYKLDTIKGGVTIRWLGESNGYYSEEVDFFELIGDERNEQ